MMDAPGDRCRTGGCIAFDEMQQRCDFRGDVSHDLITLGFREAVERHPAGWPDIDGLEPVDTLPGAITDQDGIDVRHGV